MKIVIMTPSLQKHDAVGNDVMAQFGCLKETGLDAHLFAEYCAKEFNGMVMSIEELENSIKDENNVILYHHSVYWGLGEDVIERSSAKIVMKYHNITPSNYFEKYETNYFNVTRRGGEQTTRFSNNENIFLYIGDSEFNNKDFERSGVPKSRLSVLAPFSKIGDFENAGVNRELETKLLDGGIDVLFVSRVAPNKGHKNLIETMREYVHLYDRNIRLNIVGAMDAGLSGYHMELNELIDEYDLSDVIVFWNEVDFRDLHTFYIYCDVFLLMSEHEGFCVPILEAQFHKLPIIALDRCAVKETLGDEQILIEEPDYDFFASAINLVARDEKIRHYLVEKGYANYLQYRHENLRVKFRDILSVLLR